MFWKWKVIHTKRARDVGEIEMWPSLRGYSSSSWGCVA